MFTTLLDWQVVLRLAVNRTAVMQFRSTRVVRSIQTTCDTSSADPLPPLETATEVEGEESLRKIAVPILAMDTRSEILVLALPSTMLLSAMTLLMAMLVCSHLEQEVDLLVEEDAEDLVPALETIVMTIITLSVGLSTADPLVVVVLLTSPLSGRRALPFILLLVQISLFKFTLHMHLALTSRRCNLSRSTQIQPSLLLSTFTAFLIM